ncbi:endoglucanase [Paenibacillus sp. V4I9]|uniref:cellulase family glycosylhydrolase n=1 Tax=Paenibacillus sp. V4I9 TaxID=3042308 RepID=UPI002787C867|nr:cellulase family glycosylhydrolase [Paenibacillus sp. V4I9]MDQ0885493.1 endoglucanase [Paenibacillus sp. V4I9]
MNSERENEVVGFLRADGKRLVNGEGREVLLRGVGFGSWLLPEGYMWMFPQQGDRPRRIEKMIQELIGEREAERFWDIYYDVHTSEADIQQIAAEGFNSVRVPINARFLIEDGEPLRVKEHRLKLIDRLIGWCRKHSLYVILDLHGAPGGQTGTNIDDSERDLPELFTEEHNRRLTVQLWRFLAEHYKDEWIVAGYDLLNEPLPNWFSAYNGEVMPLYRDIVKAIREVDERHLIILEGAHWATDWSIFTEKIDDNLMLQFHKYWNNPDTESIRVYLEKREEWNVPIYMGEGGENNKAWYAGAFRLFEDHNISWNFWTWKKMGKDNSPCSVKVPREWEMLVEYLEGGPKPDEITAQRILWEYLNNLAFDQCVYYRDLVDAMLGRPPVRIPAIFYGYRGEGVSYGIQQPSNQNVGFRINDRTDIRFVASARETANFEHGKGETWQDDERLEVDLAEGDWLAYEIYVPKFTDYTLYEINVHLNEFDENGSLAISIDDENQNIREPFTLEPGTHRIVVQAKDALVRLEWLEIIPTTAGLIHDAS